MPRTLRKPFDGNYPVTQVFGVNRDTYLRFGLQGHNGVDYGLPSGTAVLSAVTGTVVVPAEDPGGYGKYVLVLDNTQRLNTIYAHLSEITAGNGQKVNAGHQIGRSGNTGFSTDPHLHFGVKSLDLIPGATSLDNGFRGYEDPLGSNYTIQESSQVTTGTQPAATTPGTPALRVITFEEAFPVLYKGWDITAARANFAATGGRDKAGYNELVGFVPSNISTPPEVITFYGNYIFKVPDRLIGSRLQDIKNDFGPSSLFSIGHLENNRWVSDPFTRGQTFTFQSRDPNGSADLPFLRRALQPTLDPIVGGSPIYTFQVPDRLIGKTLQFVKDDFAPSGRFSIGLLVENKWRTDPFYKDQQFTFQSVDPTGSADLGVLQDNFDPPSALPITPKQPEREVITLSPEDTAGLGTPTPTTIAPPGARKKWTAKKAPTHKDIYNLIVDLLP